MTRRARWLWFAGFLFLLVKVFGVMTYGYYRGLHANDQVIQELSQALSKSEDEKDKARQEGLMEGLAKINITRAQAYEKGLKEGRPGNFIEDSFDIKNIEALKELKNKASKITSVREVIDLRDKENNDRYFIIVLTDNNIKKRYLVITELNSFEYEVYQSLERKFKIDKFKNLLPH